METFILPLLLLLALGAGLSFVWGAPVFGIPLLLLALATSAVWLFAARVRRSSDIHKELEEAKTRRVKATKRANDPEQVVE